MTVAKILLNNIGSLALIPIVIVIVLTLKNAQIDSLKQSNEALREQNNVLKMQVKNAELFKISGVLEELKAMKEFGETKKKEADEARKELLKLSEESAKLKSLSKKEAEYVVRLFEIAVAYAGLAPSPMGATLVSQNLYMMEGLVGELWRQHKDGGKLWREIKEQERKRKSERESGR